MVRSVHGALRQGEWFRPSPAQEGGAEGVVSTPSARTQHPAPAQRVGHAYVPQLQAVGGLRWQ